MIKNGENVSSIIKGIKKSLLTKNIDADRYIDELGQVKTEEERKKGKVFTQEEHLRGLILAQMSARVPWKRIANNLEFLNDIFFNWNWDKLENANPMDLINKVKARKCGNQAIRSQMKSIKQNIAIFKRIQGQYESLDSYITSSPPLIIARSLSRSVSRFKLTQVGFAVACEYLRNLGIGYVKPDVHIMRISGRERLNIADNLTESESIAERLSILAKKNKISATYLDNVLWLFAAKDYGEICKAKPNCSQCYVREYCNYNSV